MSAKKKKQWHLDGKTKYWAEYLNIVEHILCVIYIVKMSYKSIWFIRKLLL